MRRLVKKNKRFIGMYATISKERLDALFQKEKDKLNGNKSKEKKPLPKIVPSRPAQQSINRGFVRNRTSSAVTNYTMNKFENEYNAFIADLKKKKAEEEKKAAENVAAPVEDKIEEKTTELLNAIDEVKESETTNTVDEKTANEAYEAFNQFIDNMNESHKTETVSDTVDTNTVVAEVTETKKRRKRKKNTDTEIA